MCTHRTSLCTDRPIPVAAWSSSGIRLKIPCFRDDISPVPAEGASDRSVSCGRLSDDDLCFDPGVIGTGRDWISRKNTAEMTPKLAACPSLAPYESCSDVK